MNEIYRMKLHDVLRPSNGPGIGTEIYRVHGGWIYVIYNDAGTNEVGTTQFSITSTFVPYTDEFV